MKIQKILYIALIVILVAIFGFSAYYVGDYFLESNKQKSEFNELADIVASVRATSPSRQSGSSSDDAYSDTNGDSHSYEEEFAESGMLKEMDLLYNLNSDIVGWLTIEDTNINYPVMQAPDSVDYYLHKNFKKEYSQQGCLYARETCDINTPSDNITIYGHNMRDRSMFADLDKFLEKSFWEEHQAFTFDTLYERHTYQIFAVFRTTASVGKGFSYHTFVNAADETEFNEFVAKCKRLAVYDTDITPEYGDKLVCLSTCEYSQTNGRLVVVAYRVD